MRSVRACSRFAPRAKISAKIFRLKDECDVALKEKCNEEYIDFSDFKLGGRKTTVVGQYYAFGEQKLFYLC